MLARNRHIKSIGLAIFLTVMAFASEKSIAQVCTLSEAPSNTHLKLKDMNEGIRKSDQILFAQQDPALFCEANMKLRFLNVNPKDSASANFRCTEMTEGDLDQFVNGTLFRDMQRWAYARQEYHPWIFSLIQTEMAQNLLMGGSFNYSDQISSMTPADLADRGLQARKNSMREKVFKQKSIRVFGSLWPDAFIKKTESRPASLAANNILLQGKLCSDLTTSEILACTMALNRISEIAKPAFFENKSYMPLGVWKKIIGREQKYSEGLRLAAVKMNQKLSENKAVDGNILDDLNEAFVKSGLSHAESLDASYDVLALYGSAGANLGSRLDALTNIGAGTDCGPRRSSLCGYLDLIAKSIPILDYTNSKSGKPLYSWPKGVEGSCNTNKSYHFWMAAYLSRELVKEGYSAGAASVAAYAAGVGYQVNRDQGVAEGSIGLNAIKKSTYDPVVNIMRADLAYVFSGAQFGAFASGQISPSISIDKTLVRLLEKSPETAADYSKTNISALDQLRRYNRFKEIVVPSAPFE